MTDTMLCFKTQRMEAADHVGPEGNCHLAVVDAAFCLDGTVRVGQSCGHERAGICYSMLAGR